MRNMSSHGKMTMQNMQTEFGSGENFIEKIPMSFIGFKVNCTNTNVKLLSGILFFKIRIDKGYLWWEHERRHSRIPIDDAM